MDAEVSGAAAATTWARKAQRWGGGEGAAVTHG